MIPYREFLDGRREELVCGGEEGDEPQPAYVYPSGHVIEIYENRNWPTEYVLIFGGSRHTSEDLEELESDLYQLLKQSERIEARKTEQQRNAA
jgi:hypothetical protein